eukprot:CAMPEP_0182879474 /NCGR_PEP_ID=MMETSP0034_2-20130328/15999_1 /TAXON_ID=156128 /ORGANISM="Nephroselmis pyriformis, Strain CCMP717" /LENGTH=96 /DNA_ID=CAMNT_0025012417 /DNA_START=876 /DNA_END=1164 /DNA_ORIENTATION=+
MACNRFEELRRAALVSKVSEGHPEAVIRPALGARAAPVPAPPPGEAAKVGRLYSRRIPLLRDHEDCLGTLVGAARAGGARLQEEQEGRRKEARPST